MSDLQTVLTLAGHYGARIDEVELNGTLNCWHDDCGTADVLISWTGICDRAVCWGHIPDTLACASQECEEAGDRDPHILIEVLVRPAVTAVSAA